MKSLGQPKTAAELAAITEVQLATTAAMRAVIKYIATSDNPTAESAHQLIDSILDEYDCESPEGHIVAGGRMSAEPHEIGKGALLAGVPIVIDIYPRSKVTGYYADMSRTVCRGVAPVPLRDMYQAVAQAKEVAIAAVRPGFPVKELHLLAADSLAAAGFATGGTGTLFEYEYGFVHSLGHGLGQEVHEAPHINKTSEEVLEAGQVVTIEPGLYYPEIGGVRLEDMVLVTETGCVNLTNEKQQLEI